MEGFGPDLLPLGTGTTSGTILSGMSAGSKLESTFEREIEVELSALAEGVLQQYPLLDGVSCTGISNPTNVLIRNGEPFSSTSRECVSEILLTTLARLLLRSLCEFFPR